MDPTHGLVAGRPPHPGRGRTAGQNLPARADRGCRRIDASPQVVRLAVSVGSLAFPRRSIRRVRHRPTFIRGGCRSTRAPHPGRGRFTGGRGRSEAIEQLPGAQITLRNNRRLQAAMRSSRLPGIKTLDDFDFSFQPSIKREQIDSSPGRAEYARVDTRRRSGPFLSSRRNLGVHLADRDWGWPPGGQGDFDRVGRASQLHRVFPGRLLLRYASRVRTSTYGHDRSVRRRFPGRPPSRGGSGQLQDRPQTTGRGLSMARSSPMWGGGHPG